ncbi:hypothetical protein AY600_13555 [Phormidium willei BDU 130791]|nr:hypothetical protein AY600_13555 [Phormidium willei BDU 130791]
MGPCPVAAVRQRLPFRPWRRRVVRAKRAAAPGPWAGGTAERTTLEGAGPGAWPARPAGLGHLCSFGALEGRSPGGPAAAPTRGASAQAAGAREPLSP